MILDERVLFSDAQAITASAASTNSVDLGAEGVTYDGIQLQKSLGKSMVIPLLIQVVEDFDNLTSLDIIVQTDSDSGFGSPKEVHRQNVLLADLVAGFISAIDKVPRGVMERYMRLQYSVNGANPANGQITAGVVAAVDGRYDN